MAERGRRDFLGRALLGSLGVPLLAEPALALAPKLNPADPAAVAVGYVEKANTVDTKRFPAFKPGQNCANCSLIMLQYSPYRPCKIFPGKLVSANGWCSAWVKNPHR